MIRLFAILVLAMTPWLTPAWAQTENENWTQCLNDNPDIITKGCTALINSQGELPANLVTAFNNRGNAYLSKGEYDLAIKDYSEAIRLRPDDFYTFSNRGAAYTGKREYDLAIEDYTEAIRLKPSSAEAFYNRGNAHFSKEEYDLAIEDYSKSLQLNPSNAHALYGRGIAKQQKVDLAGAASDIAAAKKIDPAIEGKVLKPKSSATPVAVTEARPQSLSQSMPPVDEAAIHADCAVISGDSSNISSQVLSNHGVPIPLYIDESPKQLKKAVPELRGLMFQTDPDVRSGTSALQPQDELDSILKQTGTVVTTMLHEMPSLNAREEVKQRSDFVADLTYSLPGSNQQLHSNESPRSDALDAAGEIPKTVYTYRIVVKEDPILGHVLDEYRTDAHNQPIADSANSSGRPSSVGFGITWLIFLPRNFEESRFRFLGQQKIGNHETYVLAFAQIPDRSRLRTIVDTDSGRCSTFMQGIAWIDPSTFRIVRMQTDLLSPLPGIKLNKLRSMINYSEVKIPQHDLHLWLPSDVETAWRTTNQTGGEHHRFSNYKLFEATSTIHYSP